MPQADRNAAAVLSAVGVAIIVLGAAGKFGVVDLYKDTYQKYNHRSTSASNKAPEDKVVYDPNGPMQEPSAPPMEEVLGDPYANATAPPAPCAIGFISDLQYTNEQYFTPQTIQLQQQQWIYADAYLPPSATAQPQPEQTSVYADTDTSPQELPMPSALPESLSGDTTIQIPEEGYSATPQYQQPPAYEPPPAPPYSAPTPNTIKFNSTLPQGNIIRPLPTFSNYANFKLKDIKWVMFDDGRGSVKCYRVKHGKLNWFARWHGDCLISTFQDDCGKEHTIYWHQTR